VVNGEEGVAVLEVEGTPRQLVGAAWWGGITAQGLAMDGPSKE